MTLTDQKNSYIFRFQDVFGLSVKLNSVGWENKTGNYSFSGLTRKDIGGPYLFQYTISGLGMIRIKDKLYRLEPGSTFLVHFSSDYHYYMPQESQSYECLFISLEGDDAAKCWSYISEQLGDIPYMPDHCQPIRLLKSIYHEANTKKINDAYKASMMAYQFMMELYRFCKGYPVPKVWPDIVAKALKIMQEQYGEIGRLEDISTQLGVSKYHLIKLFHSNTGKTPIEYLTKIRIENAVEQLRKTNLSLEEIAQQIGFASVNYFIKVFRKYVGEPPGRFRKKYEAEQFMFD